MLDLYYSPSALSDLDQVWDEVYEASVDFDTADKYIADLRKKVSQKRKAPKTGKRLSYLGEFTGIYYVTFKNYHIFYRIGNRSMEVGRILYSKSDYMKILFGTSEFVPEDTEW